MEPFYLTKQLTRNTGTTQYSAGDVISDSNGDPIEFTDKFNKNDIVIITTAELMSNRDDTATLAFDLQLWLFDSVIADRADNLAFNITDDEMATHVGIIEFPSTGVKVGLASGNVKVQGNPDKLPLQFDCLGNKFWGQLVVRNAYTPASAEIFTMRLGGWIWHRK